MIKASRKEFLLIPLLILFAFEVVAVTNYKFLHLHMVTATWLFLISGLLIALLPFVIIVNNNSKPWWRRKWDYVGSKLIFVTVFTGFVILVIINSIDNLKAWPIDFRMADMIPQIKVCCQRLLSGAKVYEPMPQIWDGMLPTYLPAMWLPYILLEWLNVDVRWTSVFFLLFFFGLYFFLIEKRKNTWVALFPLLLICWKIFDFLFTKERTYIAFTEESVVIGYYLLLGYALIKKNPWLTGIAIALCLLSRYPLLGWIPVYVIYCWFFESRSFAVRISAVVITLFTLLFLLPFGIWQPSYFIEVPGIYLHHAIAMKEHNYDVFTTNIGFSYLFSQAQMNLLHWIGVLTVLLIPFLWLTLFGLIKKRPQQWGIFFGLCSLKFTLVLFYLFILIPYYYLFFVPVFFTLPLIFQAMNLSTDSEISRPD